MSDPKVIKVSKLDAARRQLDGAIHLWFSDGDLVAIHALVCAAHQIIEDINEKRKDTSLHLIELLRKNVTPQHLEEAMRQIRKPMMFFKHANPDPHDVIEFNPDLSELLILLAIKGLGLLGEQMSDFQRAVLLWDMLHSPIQKDRLNPLHNMLSAQQIEQFRLVEKRDFLKGGLLAIAQARARG